MEGEIPEKTGENTEKKGEVPEKTREKRERVAVCLVCTNEWVSRTGNAPKPAKCPVCGTKKCRWKDEMGGENTEKKGEIKEKIREKTEEKTEPEVTPPDRAKKTDGGEKQGFGISLPLIGILAAGGALVVVLASWTRAKAKHAPAPAPAPAPRNPTAERALLRMQGRLI